VISEARHWKIVWAALRVAVDARDVNLAESAAKMIATRDGAAAYEDRRAHVEAQTKRTRAGRDGTANPDDAPRGVR
jgi:hypothetical protein